MRRRTDTFRFFNLRETREAEAYDASVVERRDDLSYYVQLPNGNVVLANPVGTDDAFAPNQTVRVAQSRQRPDQWSIVTRNHFNDVPNPDHQAKRSIPQFDDTPQPATPVIYDRLVIASGHRLLHINPLDGSILAESADLGADVRDFLTVSSTDYLALLDGGGAVRLRAKTLVTVTTIPTFPELEPRCAVTYDGIDSLWFHVRGSGTLRKVLVADGASLLVRAATGGGVHSGTCLANGYVWAVEQEDTDRKLRKFDIATRGEVAAYAVPDISGTHTRPVLVTAHSTTQVCVVGIDITGGRPRWQVIAYDGTLGSGGSFGAFFNDPFETFTGQSEVFAGTGIYGTFWTGGDWLQVVVSGSVASFNGKAHTAPVGLTLGSGNDVGTGPFLWVMSQDTSSPVITQYFVPSAAPYLPSVVRTLTLDGVSPNVASPMHWIDTSV